MEEKKIELSVYTRPVDDNAYPAGLANAVHFAYKNEKGESVPLNRNYGILFAAGSVTDDDTIMPVGVRQPVIFYTEEHKIGICAEKILENGTPLESYAVWTTTDLIRFVQEEDVDGDRLDAFLSKTAASHPSKSLLLPEDLAAPAITYWTPVFMESLSVPSQVVVKETGDIQKIKAIVTYNDGSVSEKAIDWDLNEVDLKKSGNRKITGTIRREKYDFPLAKGYGDPVIFAYEGKWYFISTSDNRGDIGIYTREGETVADLFAEDVTEHLILPFAPERGFEQTFWAPEFHVIGGELYILFAVSGHTWGPQCHMMKLKKGGLIIREEDWEEPIPVIRKDGSRLSPDGISLDMTYIKTGTGSYVVWSYRKGMGTPGDTGSMLMIASVKEDKPWQLTSEPRVLSRPLFGWENVSGTINNEGPYAFQRDGKVYMTYSGGAANGYTYAVGLFTAEDTADLTDPSSWHKSITPVLTFYSVKGVYGPGHNAFYVNEQGELMISYHGEMDMTSHLRCDGIRRVHFRKDGTPYFQMSAEEDLPEEKRTVETTIITE